MSRHLILAFVLVAPFVAGETNAKEHLRLTQKQAAELVLIQGSKALEVNLTYEQNRLALANALSNFDWKLGLESGYESDRTQAFSPSTIADSKYIRYKSTATLQKSLLTGTALSFEYGRLTQNSDVPIGSTTVPPSYQVQDSFGITLEQALLWDAFGNADRATVRAAESSYQAAEILRADDLQKVVLSTISLYWDTYVAQENLSAALSSRDKYKKLLEVVKRKANSGYANPGELSQTLAEAEIREQTVKTSSIDYLAKLDNLLTTLGFSSETEIEFNVPDKLPSVPKLPDVPNQSLRAIRSQKLKIQAAEDQLLVSKSKSYPLLNLVGKYYTTGSDTSSESSLSNSLSGGHPKYYLGLKLTYTFGSDSSTEEIINKKAIRDLETAKYNRQLQELGNQNSQVERKVQSTFAVAESAFKLKEHRAKAVQELNRTYSQGRTDIKTLIDAMNNSFLSDVQLSKAIGDYHIALNELASIRDELIPDMKEKK